VPFSAIVSSIAKAPIPEHQIDSIARSSAQIHPKDPQVSNALARVLGSKSMGVVQALPVDVSLAKRLVS
jgi:hypothetical protein